MGWRRVANRCLHAGCRPAFALPTNMIWFACFFDSRDASKKFLHVFRASPRRFEVCFCSPKSFGT
ncbi:hypothetical protein AMC87_PD00749 (plasmid) [Rhizobium phaseoli]|nr:hypothetical protein AMC87_PD00749 [Rhizobium phaseoli]EGE61223.1 hypothetical protein RHECNPAF_12210037 [Rhizobium etli CNPAF512]